MSSSIRLSRGFYERDVLEVAPDLIGKELVFPVNTDRQKRFMITELEAYRGEEDKACHASKGRTKRTEIMYNQGGKIYVFFVYGMYWMFNIVTGMTGNPQAVLVRGVSGIDGPGKLTRSLGIDGSFYGEDLVSSERIWIEDNGGNFSYDTSPRIGIDYAGLPWKEKTWRFIIKK